MESENVISVRNLGKKYLIGERGRAYKTLRDSIARRFRRIANDGISKKNGNHRKEFWALKDISFDVAQGEVIGIIGHNGAGKSTLLKVLSRITEPSEGYANILGRIGSLLEVGTGFHHELTGRENIYLSGAILGMKKSEIDLRFDEMVAFAGVDEFIDTPIKHYSSGMNLRLGFAVAAHLEPDILLIDEVLAVGDMEFQKKCLNKMEDVATQGRTVLFVSHNMGSIKELCQSVLVLKNGNIDFFGDVIEGIQHYSQSIMGSNIQEVGAVVNQGFVRLFVNGAKGIPKIYNTEAFEVTTELSIRADLFNVDIHCFLDDAEGTQIVHNRQLEFEKLPIGIHRINATIPPLYLRPGVYTLYFKLIGESHSEIGATKVKYFSERLAVDISDSTNMFSGKVRATIIPPVEWKVDSTKPKATAIS